MNTPQGTGKGHKGANEHRKHRQDRQHAPVRTPWATHQQQQQQQQASSSLSARACGGGAASLSSLHAGVTAHSLAGLGLDAVRSLSSDSLRQLAQRMLAQLQQQGGAGGLPPTLQAELAALTGPGSGTAAAGARPSSGSGKPPSHLLQPHPVPPVSRPESASLTTPGGVCMNLALAPRSGQEAAGAAQAAALQQLGSLMAGGATSDDMEDGWLQRMLASAAAGAAQHAGQQMPTPELALATSNSLPGQAQRLQPHQLQQLQAQLPARLRMKGSAPGTALEQHARSGSGAWPSASLSPSRAGRVSAGAPPVASPPPRLDASLAAGAAAGQGSHILQQLLTSSHLQPLQAQLLQLAELQAVLQRRSGGHSPATGGQQPPSPRHRQTSGSPTQGRGRRATSSPPYVSIRDLVTQRGGDADEAGGAPGQDESSSPAAAAGAAARVSHSGSGGGAPDDAQHSAPAGRAARAAHGAGNAWGGSPPEPSEQLAVEALLASASGRVGLAPAAATPLLPPAIAVKMEAGAAAAQRRPDLSALMGGVAHEPLAMQTLMQLLLNQRRQQQQHQPLGVDTPGGAATRPSLSPQLGGASVGGASSLAAAWEQQMPGTGLGARQQVPLDLEALSGVVSEMAALEQQVEAALQEVLQQPGLGPEAGAMAPPAATPIHALQIFPSVGMAAASAAEAAEAAAAAVDAAAGAAAAGGDDADGEPPAKRQRAACNEPNAPATTAGAATAAAGAAAAAAGGVAAPQAAQSLGAFGETQAQRQEEQQEPHIVDSRGEGAQALVHDAGSFRGSSGDRTAAMTPLLAGPSLATRSQGELPGSGAPSLTLALAAECQQQHPEQQHAQHLQRLASLLLRSQAQTRALTGLLLPAAIELLLLRPQLAAALQAADERGGASTRAAALAGTLDTALTLLQQQLGARQQDVERLQVESARLAARDASSQLLLQRMAASVARIVAVANTAPSVDARDRFELVQAGTELLQLMMTRGEM